MFKLKLSAAAVLFSLLGTANSAVIESVGYSTPDNGDVRLALVFSEPVDQPLIFQPSDDSINFVFDDSSVGQEIVHHPEMGGFGIIKSAKMIEQGNASILSVNFTTASTYVIKRSGPLVLITMSEMEQAIEPANAQLSEYMPKLAVNAKPSEPVKAEPVVAKQAVETARKVAPKLTKHKAVSKAKKEAEKLTVLTMTDIDFHRTASGGSKIEFSFNKPIVEPVVTASKESITARIKGARLSDKVKSIFDVVDFGTLVKTISGESQDKDAVFTLETDGEPFEMTSYQLDNKLIIEAHSKKITKDRGDEDFEFVGEKISLDFQSIEIRAVLKLLAGFTKLNLITSDSVKGDITVNLVEVPWDQALDIILKSKGLAMRKQGTVLLVAPSAEIAVREKQEIINKKQALKLKNINSRIININFAKVSEIAKIIEESSTPTAGEGTGTAGFLSDRGKISIDERTNTLLVWDTTERLEKIETMVKVLDKPIRQVLIESRIVIASVDFSKELGARFGFSSGISSSSSALSGTLGDISISGDRIGSSGTIGSASNVSSISANQGLGVNLPVASPAGSIGLALARLPFGGILQLELSAMQAEGRGEIISSPRVITSNKKKAIIKQGTEIPYQEASSSGATSVSFKEALLKLEVTPQITPNDHIIMDVSISKDAVGAIFNGVPSINTQGVETQVLVGNGETVVLGGIHEESTINNTVKVPVLGDLPYVGMLFRNKNKIKDKSELLVFITPKIIQNNLPTWDK